MAIALVIPAFPSAAVANELASRVLACGCSLALEDHSKTLSAENEEAAIRQCEVVVVAVVGQSLPSHVTHLLTEAAKQGKRICGVWGSGIAVGPAPQVLEDYADSLVAWDSLKFCAAICDGEPAGEEADGVARAIPANSHHRC